jgi:hypothetical protein
MQLFPWWELWLELPERPIKVMEGYDHDLDVARIHAMRYPELSYVLELYDEDGTVLANEHLGA